MPGAITLGIEIQHLNAHSTNDTSASIHRVNGVALGVAKVKGAL